MWFEDPPAPGYPSSLRTRSGEEAATVEDSDLEEPPELGPEVGSFLRGLMETSEDEDDRTPPELAVTNLVSGYHGRLISAKPPVGG